MAPVIEPFGDRAVIVTCSGMAERIRAAAVLCEQLPQLVVRSGMRTVLVEHDEPDPHLVERVGEAFAVSTSVVGNEPQRESSSVMIPVRYDGQDLPDVSGMLGLTVPELIAAHVGQVWRVAMMGFAPGFGYLVPDGPMMAAWPEVPRRASPRAAVPAGSVAVSAGMSAVYPAVMPGGWHLIGTTDVPMFDARNAERPAVLDEGVVVRFTDAWS